MMLFATPPVVAVALQVYTTTCTVVGAWVIGGKAGAFVSKKINERKFKDLAPVSA